MVVVGGNIVYEKPKNNVNSKDNVLGNGPGPVLGGPFIPGKNGPQISRINERKMNKDDKFKEVDNNGPMCFTSLEPNCACRLLGKYCTASYR